MIILENTELVKLLKLVAEKVSIRPFDYNYFLKKYDIVESHSWMIEDRLLEPLKNFKGILLEDLFIKQEYQNKGYGTLFLTELKKSGHPIILYSAFGTEDFWNNNGFTEFVEHIFIQN